MEKSRLQTRKERKIGGRGMLFIMKLPVTHVDQLNAM